MFAEKMNFKECPLYERVGVAWGLAISGSECKKNNKKIYSTRRMKFLGSGANKKLADQYMRPRQGTF